MKNDACKSGLAPQAVRDDRSRGRRFPETPGLTDESPFEVDRYRVLNCMAFRRLTHKTQVFVSDDGDHFRTRLTHTLEVVAQAQRLARRLQLNDRLAGAIALAHDLGHPPFGHAGEKALAHWMRDHGGFEHNVQSLRIVDFLEHPYPGFRGLNLSFELRESLIKHRTRYDRPPDGVEDEAVEPLLEAGPLAPLEGQAANLADAMAYTLHDVEDGIGAGLLVEKNLEASSLWREEAGPVRRAFGELPLRAIRRPILNAIGRRLLDDAATHSTAAIAASGAGNVDEVRRTKDELLGFSPGMQTAIEQLQDILVASVYKNHRVVRMDSKAGRLIGDLFGAYLGEPRLLPERYADRAARQGPYRVICDYIAGMTDRFCQQEHRRLFAPFHFG